MNESIVLPLFSILFGMALAGNVWMKLLFRHLEKNHSQKYKAMGRPSLFWRNSPSAMFAMLKFLFTREHRALHDRYLSRLSDGMLIFFVLYLVLFLGLLFLILDQIVRGTAL